MQRQSRADDKKPGQKLTGRSRLVCEASSPARHLPLGLALAGFEAAVRLVDDVGTPTTTNHAIVAMAALEGLEAVADLHDRASKNCFVAENRSRASMGVAR